MRLVVVLWAASALAAAAPLPRSCEPPSDLGAALQKSPTAAVYNAIGARFAEQRRPACAIAAFQSAISAEPASWEGHYNLALALIEQKRYKQAQPELQAVIRARSHWPDAHNALGVVFESLAERDNALAEFQAALTADPHNVFALQHATNL